VREESDAPWQILLGSREPHFCVLIGLAIWLEYYLGGTVDHSPYVFDFSGDDTERGGIKTTAFVNNTLSQDIYENPDFVKEKAGPIGAYSIRKFAATRSLRSGATKDERDYRGRWKNRRVSDRYDDPELPYPDAKVAGLLCPGGPCSYRIKSDSPVTDDWIAAHVTTNISASTYGRVLGKLLGKALLWIIFSDKRHWVPEEIVKRVKTAYNQLLGDENGTNPIEKRLLVITGDNATLLINEVINMQVRAQQGGGEAVHGLQDENLEQQAMDVLGGHIESHTTRQLIHTLLNQMGTMQSHMANMEETLTGNLANLQTQMQAQYQVHNRNMIRIAAQPIRQLNRAAPRDPGNGDGEDGIVGAPEGGGADHPPAWAELSNVRDLYGLWQEYHQGIGGRKAARLFSRAERGRVKFKYCRRKVVWDLVSRLVNSGLTSQVACDRIYAVYGPSTSVTNIIKRIQTDIKNWTMHDNLRV
jgi:hypothetical protein